MGVATRYLFVGETKEDIKEKIKSFQDKSVSLIRSRMVFTEEQDYSNWDSGYIIPAGTNKPVFSKGYHLRKWADEIDALVELACDLAMGYREAGLPVIEGYSKEYPRSWFFASQAVQCGRGFREGEPNTYKKYKKNIEYLKNLTDLIAAS
jgi:hypothetical protein